MAKRLASLGSKSVRLSLAGLLVVALAFFGVMLIDRTSCDGCGILVPLLFVGATVGAGVFFMGLTLAR